MATTDNSVIEDPVLKRVTWLIAWTVGTTFLILTGGFGVYLSLSDAIGQNRTDIQVERTRINQVMQQLQSDDGEIQRQLDRINDRLDRLIQ